MATTPATLELQSLAFSHGGHIPPLYTCEEKNINPPIEIKGLPADAETMVLIMEDPDAPGGTFYHWLMWNILPTRVINENTAPGTCGKNSFGNQGYGGPCPPDGEHRYFFRIFALDTRLELKEGAEYNELVQAIEGHILAKGELMGLYKKRGESTH
jgi:Raf kinase inhibitor-like YbhB/YbcL family protein